ncbi:hypothetical protein OB955_11525 [Halobacteria archaeon AArc-m2/3/4]|uniref:Uncharacterized protein n=1 Tax=Natronoglomus mannanivorans TaxID=2979990 RepID=A0ABT2QER7_9EURY|nr:hypothetical protein [Halobacteria archaeon AArc-m2/3/4]
MTTGIGAHPLISFDVGPETIHVRDELEEQDLQLCATAPDELDPQPALTDLFMFPVDNAITVTVSELHADAYHGTALWNADGEHLGEFTTTPWELPRGTYFVNIQGTVNGYLRIDDATFTGVHRESESGDAPLEFTFDEPTQVSIGARSFHTRPQTTITVPDEPEAMLEALAYLGSSIKEYSCERSWPTLRGHPPAIERGDRLEIPPELSRPETGVTISVPATYADVYRVAPLVFYLGADVEVGDRPELRLENGYVEPLETDARSLEETVDELLETCLLLDSLTRADGYLSGPRYEYDELAPHLPFYPPNLYEESISAQLLEYLEVSPSLLEPYVPRWPMTAVLQPRPEDVELLPALLNVLSKVHVDDGTEETTVPAAPTPSETSVSTAKTGPRTATGWDSTTGTETNARQRAPTDRVLDRNRTESAPQSRSPILTCYTGSGTDVGIETGTDTDTDTKLPANASCIRREAFENALSYSLSEIADAEITYVTDSHPRGDRVRQTIDDTAPTHRLEPGRITVLEQPSKRDVARTLESDLDFLYCDLPLSSDGIECRDGVLDPAEVDDVGVKTFVLSGSAILTAGLELVRRGAFAGAILENAVSPDHVVRLTKTLLQGHPLVEAVRLTEIDDRSTVRFVGNPAHPIVRRDGGAIPQRLDVVSTSADEHDLFVYYQLTDFHRIGSVSRFIDDCAYDAYQLNGTTVRQPHRLSTSDVVSLLEDDSHVLRLNGQPYDGEVDPETFVRESVRRTLRDVQ